MINFSIHFWQMNVLLLYPIFVFQEVQLMANIETLDFFSGSLSSRWEISGQNSANFFLFARGLVPSCWKANLKSNMADGRELQDSELNEGNQYALRGLERQFSRKVSNSHKLRVPKAWWARRFHCQGEIRQYTWASRAWSREGLPYAT